MKIVENIRYADFDECILDIYLPGKESLEASSVFVYFHGGGLEGGDKADALVLAEYLTKHGICVASANYRMYPKAVFPEFVTDAAACVAWVFQNIGRYGDFDRIYVGGSSAGACLSMLLCFDPTYLSVHGLSPLDVAGYIHDAGQPTVHYNILRERGIDTRRVIVDEAAPIYHIGTQETYSNMMFIVSDNDMENRYEQTILAQSTLKHFGHDVKVELMHGDHCEYVGKIDENGDSILGKIIRTYVESWMGK